MNLISSALVVITVISPPSASIPSTRTPVLSMKAPLARASSISGGWGAATWTSTEVAPRAEARPPAPLGFPPAIPQNPHPVACLAAHGAAAQPCAPPAPARPHARYDN